LKMTSKRGRVMGRALAKQINRDASWSAQFLRTVYGNDDDADLTSLLEKCILLDQQEKELEKLDETIDPRRHYKAIRAWLERFYGKRLSGPISCWPSLVVKAARKDIDRDREVYRYYAGLARIERVEKQLCRSLGWQLVWAIRKRDYSGVHRVISIAERLREKGNKLVDQKRAWFVVWAGRGPDGKINRTPRFTCSQFARLIDCDKREVKRFCAEYGVAPRKGLPGRPRGQK
jgi:hypothetical protein